MSVDKEVGCIDLASNSCCTPGFVSKPSDSKSDYHYHLERVALTPHPGPILISFDENRFLQNDEMFVSLSGRSRFLLVLAMMLPLSVAFTGLSKHILSPISFHVSTALFSPTNNAVHTKNQAVTRKSLIDKILSREVSERRSISEASFMSKFTGMSREISSLDFFPSTSWIIEKSNARYFVSVYMMRIINLLFPNTDKIESKVLKKQNKLDLPPFVEHIWNRVKMLDRSMKANKREVHSEFSDPMFTWVKDSSSDSHKSLGSSAPGYFPLIQRFMNRNSEEVKNPHDGMNELHPDSGDSDDYQKTAQLSNNEPMNAEASKDTSSPGLTPVTEEDSSESFIPLLLRYFATFSSGQQHTVTHAYPTPSFSNNQI